MAVGVQVPPSAPSNEKPHFWGFFVLLRKALGWHLQSIAWVSGVQLIRVRAFQSVSMFLLGQFLHVCNGIAFVDNFLTQ